MPSWPKLAPFIWAEFGTGHLENVAKLVSVKFIKSVSILDGYFFGIKIGIGMLFNIIVNFLATIGPFCLHNSVCKWIC